VTGIPQADGLSQAEPKVSALRASIPDAFERRIEFSPAFDKRSSDPAKNFGIGAVRIWFYLIGPEGAVQWQIGTDWYVPSAQDHLYSLSAYRRDKALRPQAWDLGYHSPRPLYEGQEPNSHDCEVLGGPCYYDGSSLNAERLIRPFLEGGSEAVWRELEDFYRSTFAQAIEARRAETGTGSVHESAVPEGDAP
jgi:hypothetical protein